MATPFDVGEGFAPERVSAHRPSVKAKGASGDQTRQARMESARKADRVIFRMTSQGRDREEALFQIMEGKKDVPSTMQDIDSDTIGRIAARISDAEKGAPNALQEKISRQIIGKRREAVSLLCQNQDIRTLYQGIYGTFLPLQEALPHIPDSEISAFVLSFAKLIKEWKALPEAFKHLYEPVEVRAIFDNPEELEKIMEAVYSNKLLIQSRDRGQVSGEIVFHSREEVRAKVREIVFITQRLSRVAFITQKTLVRNALSRLKQLEVTVSPRLRKLYDITSESGRKLQSSEFPDALLSTTVLSLFQLGCQNFQEQVDKFETLVIEDIQKDLGVERAIVEQIFRGAQENWKNFIEIMPDGIVKQKHNIKGLKIYMLPGTKQLVADYGKEVIREGTFKRVKEFYRLGAPEGIRLTSRGKGLKRPIKTEGERRAVQRLHAFFAYDAKTELGARIVLSGVPNIAGLTAVRYYNKNGVIKTRYIMTKYDGDLFSIIADPKNKEKALQCCRGVLRGLIGMHKKKYIHGDLKSGNVLVQENQGYLSDFGLLNRENNPINFTGNLIYMAPETLFKPGALYSPKMDVFSIGIMLFEVVDQDRYYKWFYLVKKLQDDFTKKTRSIDGEILKVRNSQHFGTDEQLRFETLSRQKDDLRKSAEIEYRKALEDLHSDVSKGAHPLSPLIKDLISYTPEDRPSAEQAEKRFLEVCV